MRAAELVADLHAIFESGNANMDIAPRLRANLAAGESALQQMSATNLFTLSEAERRGDPRLGEMRHFHSGVRQQIEAFRQQNLDLYHQDDPQLPHLIEAKLVSNLYQRLAQQFPEAALGVACSEAAQFCFESIRRQGAGTDVELVHLKRDIERLAAGERQPDHVFVVIARDHATDPEDFATWNEDAVVCDASKRLVYPKSEIAAKFAELQTFTLGSTRTEVLARAHAGTQPSIQN